MADVLLTSAAFVRQQMSISDNLAGKYLLPAIREAQEVQLRGILGDALTDRCKALCAAGELSGAYKDLVDRAQYFLAYTAVLDVLYRTTYKVTSFGVAKASDDNLTPATLDEVVKQQGWYEQKADAACHALQNWLLQNRASFP